MACEPRTFFAPSKRPSIDEVNGVVNVGSMKRACLGAVLLMVGWAEGCGAVTLEPLPPEEPSPEAAPPPRLLRRDAGTDAGNGSENTSP